ELVWHGSQEPVVTFESGISIDGKNLCYNLACRFLPSARAARIECESASHEGGIAEVVTRLCGHWMMAEYASICDALADPGRESYAKATRTERRTVGSCAASDSRKGGRSGPHGRRQSAISQCRAVRGADGDPVAR